MEEMQGRIIRRIRKPLGLADMWQRAVGVVRRHPAPRAPHSAVDMRFCDQNLYVALATMERREPYQQSPRLRQVLT